VTREFDMGDETPVQKLTPHWRENLRDLVLVLGLLGGGALWLFGLGKKWVESPEFQRYQEQQDLRARFQDDRFRNIETRVNEMTVKVGETNVRVETIQKSAERIENKLDEKHRR
jgi:hypothetical protein